MKLSVCIPAYKRPDLLAGALDSVISSCRSDCIEVLVCDDSPDRQNQRVVMDKALSHPNVRYVHNENRLGLDANIKKCFDEASGDYVLVMGEDDHLTDMALTHILDTLHADNPDVVITNYVYCSNDYKRDIGKPLFDAGMQVTRRGLLGCFYKLGFVGSFVISKRAWSKFSHAAPVGTYFHHLSVLGKNFFLSPDLEIGFVNDVCVRNRAEDVNSSSWADRSLDVHFGYFDALHHFKSDLDEEEWKHLMQSSRALFRPQSFLWLLSKRADGVYGTEAFARWFSKERLSVKAGCYLAAIFPMFAARSLKKIYRLRKQMGSLHIGARRLSS
jgi:glycosyltransferase involved in cell wall biosynthesis